MPNRIVKVILRGDVAGLVAPLAAASKAVKDTSLSMTASTKEADKFRHGLTAVGDSALKLGLVAAAGLGAVVVASANFDAAMSKVDAATHETAGNMDLLRAAAIKAGAETVFSATESADAITALAKAGLTTSQILSGGLSGALALASAGELDVATAADIAATALKQFGLDGKDVPHVADLLAAAAGKAQGEVTDMAASLKYVGPVAAQMGISIEETVGTIAELASQGILGEQAGTALRGMLTSLTSPSKVAADAMKKYNIELYDAQGNFVGLRGVAGQLQQSMGKLGNAERDQALGRIFGNEQITAARILYKGGAADVDTWTKAVDDQGYAADTAARKLDNLKGDVEQFTGSLETALIGTGSGSQGPIRDIVQGATDITNAYNNLPDAVHNGTSSLLATGAVAGLAVFAFSRIIKSVSDTRVALDELGPAGQRAGRLLKTGLAVGAIISGLDILNDTIDAVMNHNLDSSNLGRSLDALANGDVTGELADKFGNDLTGLVDQLEVTADGFYDFQRKASKLPGIGGIIADTPFDGLPGVDDAAKNIETLDQALAGLVEGGEGEKAASIIQALTDAGADPKDISEGFDQYALAVENAKHELDETTAVSLSMADALAITGDLLEGKVVTGYDAATGATKTFAKAQELSDKAQAEAIKAAREQGQAFIGLGKDVDNAKVSLGGWIKQLEDQAKALENFTSNAVTAGKKGVREGLINALEEAGPAGAMRLQQLANATDEEITRANRAWVRGQRAIQAYTDMKVPPKKIEVEPDQALSAIERIRAAMAGIKDKNVAVNYYVNQMNAVNKGAGGGIDGDPNTPWWTGGYTGDGPWNEPAGVVHRGEVVLPQDVVKRDWAMLSQRYGYLPGFAAGGLVGGHTMTVSGSRDDSARRSMDRFKSAVDAATNALDKEKTKREDLISQRNDVSGTVRDNFRSDLFGDEPAGSVWMSAADRAKAGIGDVFSTLTGDIADAAAFGKALKGLTAKGLDGAAFAEVATTASLQQAQAFAAMSKGEVARYEALFNRRAQVTTALGTAAGQAAYGAAIRAQTSAVNHMSKEITDMKKDIKAMKKSVDGAPDKVGAAVGRTVNRNTAPKRGTT